MAPASDLLHLLMLEQRTHRELLVRLGTGTGDDREGQLRSAVLDLAAHLAAKEVLVHPLAATVLSHGPRVLTERRREGRAILHHLRIAGHALPDGSAFAGAVEAASREHRANAEREQLEVFPYARRATTPSALCRLGQIYPGLRRRATAAYLEHRRERASWTDEELVDRLVQQLTATAEETGELPGHNPHGDANRTGVRGTRAPGDVTGHVSRSWRDRRPVR